MGYYGKDPEFPDAVLTHQYSLREAQSGRLEMIFHEFRKAREDRWADWVAARTPYGEEAQSIQNWQYIQLHNGAGIVPYPKDEELREKRHELKALLLKIDEYFFPPDTGPILTRESIKYALCNNPDILQFLIGVSCFVIFAISNPFQLPPITRFITSCMAGWIASPLSGYFFGAPSYRPFVAGIGEKRLNDVNLGDAKLYEVLDAAKVNRADEIYALFGEWKYFAKHQSPPNTAPGAASAMPPEPTHTIKFQNNTPDLTWFNTKKGLWHVGRADFHGLHEGPSILFVYSVQRRTDFFSKLHPLALLDLQSWKVTFFSTPSPFTKNAMVVGLASVPVGMIGALLLGFKSVELLSAGLMSFCAIFFIAGAIMSVTFQNKIRHAITDLAMRDDYKRALLNEYMKLAHPDIDHTAGRL